MGLKTTSRDVFGLESKNPYEGVRLDVDSDAFDAFNAFKKEQLKMGLRRALKNIFLGAYTGWKDIHQDAPPLPTLPDSIVSKPLPVVDGFSEKRAAYEAEHGQLGLPALDRA